jgi:hypothetical protein
MVQGRYLFRLFGIAAAMVAGPLAALAQTGDATAARSETQLPDAPAPVAIPAAPPPATAAAPEPAPSSSSSSSALSSAAPDAPPRYWTNNDPNAQVTVLENSLLRVRTNEPISSRQTRAGAELLFTLSEDVVVDGVLIVPRGAALHGTVVESKQPGTLTGSASLVLKLTALDLGGRSYPLYSYQLKVVGASKTKPTETKVKNGAVIGTIVGGIFSGSAKGEPSAAGKLIGMGTGAALGAGVGTAVSAATPAPILSIPAESQMDFYLASPISVVPASEKEAKRISQGLHAGGPVLYVRGDNL